MLFLFSSLSPILMDVKHRKQQSIIYYSWTSLVCVDCLSYVFLSSSPIALQITEHFSLVISGAQKKTSDGFVIFSEFSLACLPTLALTNPAAPF